MVKEQRRAAEGSRSSIRSFIQIHKIQLISKIENSYEEQYHNP